jgi:hypothetical protein
MFKEIIFLVLIIMRGSLTIAGTFKVNDPIIEIKKMVIPLENITCIKEPFYMARMQITLSESLGSKEQRGILSTPSHSFDLTECTGYIAKLRDSAVDNKIEMELKIITRSVVKLNSINTFECDGAQQELVLGSLDNIFVYLSESIYRVEGNMSCPIGIDPDKVFSLDKVLYELHENGIPTSTKY